MSDRDRRTRQWRRRGVVLVAVAAVVTLLTSAAAPADTPAAGPTTAVAGGPAEGSVTVSATATFTYTSPTGTAFRCALDDAVARACSATGITYPNLGSGRHVFRVSARAGTGAFGPSASRSWEIDRRPPTIAISAPTGNRPYSATTWDALCDGRGGVCGSAGDSHGVSGVTVAIRDAANRYWSGSAFDGTGPLWMSATGTDDWHLAFAVPTPDGTYTVLARATDRPGNETDPALAARRTFRVDTTAPPPPTFTAKPDDPTAATTARFKVHATPDGTSDEQRLRCALDGGTLRNCGETFTVTRLAVGNHCVRAVAVDPWGNVSRPQVYCWDVIIERGFTIRGLVRGDLAPGVTRPVELDIDNPFRFPLRLLTFTATVDKATSRPDCEGTVNFTARRTEAMVGAVLQPGPNHLTVESAGPNLPEVTMLETHVRQDECIGTTITLTFGGTATKSTEPGSEEDR